MAVWLSCVCELASVSRAVEELGGSPLPGRVGAVRSLVGLQMMASLPHQAFLNTSVLIAQP